MELELKKVRLRNPHSLGVVSGSGVIPAHANHPHLEELPVSEIMFQLIEGDAALVGYSDMDPDTMENVLCMIGPGEVFPVRLETGNRGLILGDFGVATSSEKDRVLITIKY